MPHSFAAKSRPQYSTSSFPPLPAFQFSSRNLDWFGIPPPPFPPPSPLIALKFNFLAALRPFPDPMRTKSHITQKKSLRRQLTAIVARPEPRPPRPPRPEPGGLQLEEGEWSFHLFFVAILSEILLGDSFFPTLSFGAPGKREDKSLY